MKNKGKKPGMGQKRFLPLKWYVVAAVFLMFTAMSIPQTQAQPPTGLTVIGVDANGNETTLTDYRWLVEEDLNYHVPLTGGGAPEPDPETLAVSFHRSYMPVVAKGCVSGDATWISEAVCNELPFTDLGGHYYVSVVPRAGYSIGGASFTDGESPTVYVNQHPIPSAQITILIFEDNFPINNAPDLPGEDPANPDNTDMSGFTIIVEDAGGRWGASAGVQSLDAFGNPLGTTYDATGNVSGFRPLITGPSGRLTIKNLAPGKYGIQAVPPAGGGWQQTSTIEGTKIIDAWVKANEPPFFAEFGVPGFHVFIGFVQEFDTIPHEVVDDEPTGQDISGTVVNQHMSRPPDYAFYNGSCFGHTTPWVGLNDLSVGIGKGIYAAPTDEDCNFTIPNVPDGNYQLVVWDNNLDLIFAFKGLSIVNGVCNSPNGLCAIGDVPVFQWFHRQEHFVYNDIDADGVYDPGDGEGEGETPILEQATILRWRDGTVYQENVTDPAGLYAFDQVFPFFSWLVAEVDFARFEATSLTVVVDNGGPIPGLGEGGVEGPSPENDLTFGGAIAPQDQTNPPDPECASADVCTETDTYRIDLGPVLTAGFQGFIGQTSAFQWGKRHYADGENGGISGIVFYAITRAEDDPAMAAAEPWEPGIPGVPVNLYESLGVDPETGVATKGSLLNTTTTDSWDDSIPTGCKYGNDATGPFVFDPDGPGPIPPTETDCYDGLRVFNQVRPAVFDGGYAFDSICEDVGGMLPDGTCTTLSLSIPAGDYIVEVMALPGYEILKPEDKNVDFGDVYEPALELLPAPCVGEPALIPPYLTLFPDEQIQSPFAWETGEYTPVERPLCDSKLVTVSTGFNAAADFWLFTEVPVAAHGFGFILDDTQNEFDPNSPQFGEKYAPPFVPVTIRDWTGRVIGKTLSDQYGRYNFLAPSTITTNLPAPSGMSPNMLTTCMNDPGDDPANPDPNHNQLYSTFCYTFQYMPGTTTYLDTPVVPVAAFTGPDQFPLDCEYPDGTPRISSVTVSPGSGPYIPVDPDTGTVLLEQTITITAMGPTGVQNPNYCNAAAGACPTGTDTENKIIDRDYGFGTGGSVSLGDLTPVLTNITWDDAITITATVPAGTSIAALGGIGGRQLTVTRDNGQSTKAGITVQVGIPGGSNVIMVSPDTSHPLASPIQDAIDLAGPRDLILVSPGNYNEMVIMWKPVRLQGFGEGSTFINAINAPTEKLEIARGRVEDLVLRNRVDLLPGQERAFGGIEPAGLFNETGAGILVLTSATGGNSFSQNQNRGARIDGFTIKGADISGGIVVNGNAPYLNISNNRVAVNQGFFGGGIRVGHPDLVFEEGDGAIAYTDAENDFVTIHNNQVVFNGGLDGAGAGISMCTGSDSYQITQNWVCGNFSLRDGGGIGHLGKSDGTWVTVPDNGPQNQRVWTLQDTPLIEDNTIIFNESFFQGQTVSGGGIFIGGAQPLTPGGLTPGSGNVQVISNLIQGNSAGAGDGGGIRLAGINGQDVAANPENDSKRNGNRGRNDPDPWYAVDVFNNMIVNNVAALAGGGMSLQDALDVRIAHNAITNNDSLGTAGEAFLTNPNESSPQPGAGIVTRSHGGTLGGLNANIGDFSDPTTFADNIVWQNRKFFFLVDQTSGCAPGSSGCVSSYGLCPDLGTTPTINCELATGPGLPTDLTVPWYDDLAVIGTTDTLACDPGTSCILTGGTDPLFVAEYVNGARSSVFQPEINTAIQTPPAFDEGGNFIRPSYGPLALYDDATPDDGDPGILFGDYHILGTSPAVDAGDDITATYPELLSDIDGDPRPQGIGVDIGADEVQ